MAERGRAGNTLLELLVVCAIAGVLVMLTLSGVMRVRDAAARMACRNNLRQNMLAAHNYAAARSDKLPTIVGRYDIQFRALRLMYYEPMFVALLPYLDQGGMYSAYKSAGFMAQDRQLGRVPTYRCPADPSDDRADRPTQVSYGANAYVFSDNPKLVGGSFPDGTSNTVALVEHYATCGRGTFEYQLVTTILPFHGLDLPVGTTAHEPLTPHAWAGRHRPTVNDGGKRFDNLGCSYDFYPKTQPGGDTLAGWAIPEMPTIPGVTFQVKPTTTECRANVANSPHPVMNVAMVDGSVRSIAPGIAERVYWGAMTRNGGEALGDW